MSRQVTRKFIKEGFKNIIKVGYCDLQYLLQLLNCDYYTAGIYGWNADIYIIDSNTVIVTGYRPFGNIESNYYINKKYDKKANEIMCQYQKKYEERKEELNELLQQYIKETLEVVTND